MSSAEIPTATPDSPALVDALAFEDPNALTIKVGTHGHVQLRDCMPRLVRPGTIGIESAIVEAARVSYGVGTKSVSTDLGLLRYLVRNEHMSPFEMVKFTFVIRCEIFTARQWFRHRCGNFNEESARYSEINDDYYAPDANEVRMQATINKQGSSEENSMSPRTKVACARKMGTQSLSAFERYQELLEAGVAREQARAVLPVGTYTKFHWGVDARNLMHFLHLRMDSHAQFEIRQYANAIYTILGKVAPHLMAIFDTYIRGSVRLSALEVRALREGTPPIEMSDAEKREWVEKKKLLAAS